jgi:hypothetical protein
MPYILVKQAAQVTGKSEKTIRRLANSEASKSYITYEDGKLLIEISYLQQHYPLIKHGQEPKITPGQTIDTPTQTSIDTVQPQSPVILQHTIDLLKQELKHKEELYHQISHEKDKRIEILERSLLMLGEGIKKDQEKAEVIQIEPAALPEKKRRWWQW